MGSLGPLLDGAYLPALSFLRAGPCTWGMTLVETFLFRNSLGKNFILFARFEKFFELILMAAPQAKKAKPNNTQNKAKPTAQQQKFPVKNAQSQETKQRELAMGNLLFQLKNRNVHIHFKGGRQGVGKLLGNSCVCFTEYI